MEKTLDKERAGVKRKQITLDHEINKVFDMRVSISSVQQHRQFVTCARKKKALPQGRSRSLLHLVVFLFLFCVVV